MYHIGRLDLGYHRREGGQQERQSRERETGYKPSSFSLGAGEALGLAASAMASDMMVR
jgi:hypothetical protein